MNHLKSSILTAALALVSLTSANAQNVITQWNFEAQNTTPSDWDRQRLVAQHNRYLRHRRGWQRYLWLEHHHLRGTKHWLRNPGSTI